MIQPRALRFLPTLVFLIVTSFAVPAFAQTFTPELTPTEVTVTAGGAPVAFQAAINHDPGFSSSIRVFFPSVPFGLTIGPPEQFLNPPYNAVTFMVSAVPGMAAGVHDINVVYSSSETKTTPLRVRVVAAPVPPGFRIDVLPAQVEMRQGQQQTVSVSVKSVSGFAGVVNLTNDANPSLLELSPASFSVSVPANGTASQPLSIRARSDAPAGSANFLLYGISGTLQDSAPVSVNVIAAPPPDFTLALSATDPAAVAQGGMTRFRITTTGLNGFNAPIQIALAPSAGVSVQQPAFTMNASELREVVANVSSAAASGPASIGVTATSGTLQRTAVASFNVVSAAQPDFTFVASAPNPPSIRAGEASRILVSATPVGGFTASITVEIQSSAAVVPSERTFSLSPGNYSKEILLTATASGSGPQTVMIRATSGSIQRTSPVTLTVIPNPAGIVPVIDGLSPDLTTPSPEQIVYVVGRNFMPGAIALSQTAGVRVERTVVRSPGLAEVVITVRQGVPAGGYRLDLRNPDGATTPDGGRLRIRERNDLGAALGVTTAAILYPVQGTVVMNGEAIHARALLATTGTGTITGQWALDGVRFDSFTATVAGGRLVTAVGRCPQSEGLAAQVCTNVPVPPLPWGESHRLELIIETPRRLVSPQVTLIGSPDSATGISVYSPADGAEISEALPRFSWTLVPGATGYELEFQTGEGDHARSVRFRTSEAEWRPRQKDLQRLGSGVFRWRVGVMRPGDVRDEPTRWFTITIRAAAIARKVSEVAYAGDAAAIPLDPKTPPESSATTAPPPATYTVASNATFANGSGEKSNARAQLSSQGEVGQAAASSKFTGDLSYGAGFDPKRVVQESRNWLIQAGTPAERAGGDVRFGYTTPDFTEGAEYLTSGFARTGVIGRARSKFGSLSYYQPIETAIHGVLSANPENLEIRSLALSTPEGRPYVIRLIGLEVEEPANDLFGLGGSRMRTLGLFGRYSVSSRIGFVGEVARGKVTATDGTLPSRDGVALRLGMNGIVAGVTYDLALRSVDANFVNPANRGLTPGGVSDRISTDLNLGKSIGRTSLTLSLRRQEQGRTRESTLPEAQQTALTAGMTTMFGIVGVNLSANMTRDRGEADDAAFLPETRRELTGVSASFSETVGRYSFSQALSLQRTKDEVNPLSDQKTGTLNLSASGTLMTNVTMSASATAMRTEADPLLGTTDNWTLSLQPSIALPFAALSFQPTLSLSKSKNDVLHNDIRTEGFQAIVQWLPTWFGSLVGAQVSTSWNRTALIDAPSLPITRTYQGSVTIRLNTSKGMGMFASGTP